MRAATAQIGSSLVAAAKPGDGPAAAAGVDAAAAAAPAAGGVGAVGKDVLKVRGFVCACVLDCLGECGGCVFAGRGNSAAFASRLLTASTQH